MAQRSPHGLARLAFRHSLGARHDLVHHVVASLAALIGIVLMAGLGVEGGLFGDLLALGMTLCMAAMMVIARRFHNIPTMPAACLSALLSGLVCWPFGEPLAVSGYELLLLSLFGLVSASIKTNRFSGPT